MSRTIDASELSAYVDGDLPPGRMAEIEAAAATDPALRRHLDELLANHRTLRALAQAERDSLGEPSPLLMRLGEQLTDALGIDRSSRRRPRKIPIALTVWRQVAGLAAAAAIGWGAASWAAPHGDALSSFIDESTEVHRVADLAPGFSREASAPVIDSLGRLFDHKLTPPDLTEAGFELLGIDIAATDSGPVAVFFYTDPEARRLSLVLSLDTPILDALGRDSVAPRVTTYDGLSVAYGQEGGVAFALIGALPEPNVRRLAMHAAMLLTN